MDFKLENLVCEAGKKISGFWNIEGYSIPTTIINGEKEGKVIAISSGIHNCEYVGIQSAIELSQELKPENISGTVIIFHPVNYSGFFKKIPTVMPEDNKNLNRAFPGEKTGTISDKIAYHFSKFLYPQLDFFIDIQKALDKYDFSDKSEEIYGGQITSKELTSDKIINNLEFGIGVAYKNHEYYDSKYENKNLDIWTHTPIYATGKYKMSDNSTNTKYLKINLGYAIGTFNDEEYIDKKKQSGIYYGIGAGIEYKILSFDLIYQVNKNAYKKNNSMQNDSRITFSIDYKFDS